jgi:glutamate synthase domain-containing protein 2
MGAGVVHHSSEVPAWYRRDATAHHHSRSPISASEHFSNLPMPKALTVDLHHLARFVNTTLLALPVVFFAAGYFFSFWFHFLTVSSLFLLIVNFFYRHVQKQHTLLGNFGILGQARYLIESVGPEFRQYLFLNDREERPFNRAERSEIYRKAKDVDSAGSFGTLLDYGAGEVKLRHSMFPTREADVLPFRVTFGEARGVARPYTIGRPMIISAMSYGALGSPAVRALARGAARAGIPMNTGEGGHPKYPFMEDCDLIFQLGTAKFGARHGDGSLDEDKLRELAAHEQVRMIEIKFSQGAKPGKGGLLPAEKITREIADLRGVPMGEEVVSPPYHTECRDLESTVTFIARVQDLVEIPVGIKMCVGSLDEVADFVEEMKRRDRFPDFITIDGGEGGTGAAPTAFMDRLGMPLYTALHGVVSILENKGVRDRVHILAAGKLVNAGRMLTAFALGADACYTARGFMFAIGCIQARECGNNTCPVGITTHDRSLQNGFDIEAKSLRVEHYVRNTVHELEQMFIATGKRRPGDLSPRDLYIPTGSDLWRSIPANTGAPLPDATDDSQNS